MTDQLPAALIFIGLLGGLGWARAARSAQPAEPRPGSRLLPRGAREYLFWLLGPLERALVHRGVSPNTMTLTGLALAALAALALACGHFGLGGFAYLLVGACDLLDGRIARSTGQVSRAGAYFDSVIDRYAEFAVLAGLAVYYRSSLILIVVIAFLLGSFMVSYTRARAEGLGVKSAGQTGIMQRAERLVYLGGALVLSPIAAIAEHSARPKFYLTALALIVLAATTHATAIRRFSAVLRHLRRERRPRPRRQLNAPATSASSG